MQAGTEVDGWDGNDSSKIWLLRPKRAVIDQGMSVGASTGWAELCWHLLEGAVVVPRTQSLLGVRRNAV